MQKAPLLLLLLLMPAFVHGLLLADARLLPDKSLYLFGGYGNILFTNADFFLIPDAGVRIGMSDVEWGFKLWGIGIAADWKWQFFGDRYDSFYGLALDVELGVTTAPFCLKASPALIIDMMIIRDFHLFTSLRWTYNTLYPDSGMNFVPSLGFRLFTDETLSVIVEAGVGHFMKLDLSELQIGFAVRYRLSGS